MIETTKSGLQCPFCKGRGTEVDYVGLQMRSVEVECSHCKGNGTIKASPIRQGELSIATLEEKKDEILIALLDIRQSGLWEPSRVNHWLDKADELFPDRPYADRLT